MNHTKEPLVSIITPSYNQGHFIEQTIKSVIEQDYPYIEYIVIDGASNDNTLDILKKYEAKLTWISEPDNGQSDAINKGFGMASGDILYWINSDDILLPGAVSKIVSEFEINPEADIIYGRCNFIDTENTTTGEYPVEEFNFRKLAQFNYICQPSTFFRKDAFYHVDGINEELMYALDYDLWIKMAQHLRFRYLPELLASFRLHDSSKTVDSEQSIENSKETLSVVYKYYNWAPANRVYSYVYQLTEAKLKNHIKLHKPFSIIIALSISLLKYLQLNKGIIPEDLRRINLKYLKKLFIDWNTFNDSY